MYVGGGATFKTGGGGHCCTGSIVHHFFAGYGGGRKAMLPGVTAYETIRHNHSMMFHPNAVIGRLAGNPVYLDQLEGVEMCRPAFLLNVVLDEDKRFLQVFSGDYIQAHREACASAARRQFMMQALQRPLGIFP